MSAKKEKTEKKKKNVFFRIVGGLFGFIAAIILVVILWITVNAFIRSDITDYVPEDYSVHLRTDSLWDSVNPLLDLQAADLLLSEPALASTRGVLIDFRQSPLRQNKLVDLVLSRRLDFLLYENNQFAAVLDTGFLSGIVKLVPYAAGYIHIKNVSEKLSVVKNNGFTYLTFMNGETPFYIYIKKNLVFVTGSSDLLKEILKGGHSESMAEAKKNTFEGKLESAFSVTADSKKILSMIQENNYVKAVSGCIPEDRLSSIDFGITDHQLKLSVNFPYDIESLDETNPVASVLKRESRTPVIVQKLPDTVQYYTVLSAGTLQDLKNAFFHAAESSMDLEAKWKTAENLSRAVFHETLEILFFSWTGDEFAVLGLENKADPVFAIKIEDEKKRQQVFETLFKSIILQNDTSLILDNIRLPRIELPSFLQNILEVFGLRIPSPYYMVRDGFMYLSQSPENLSAIHAAVKNGKKLSQNETWKEISGKSAGTTSVSLFYNLERSIPFFIKSKSSVSKVLQFYNVGRADVSIKRDQLEVTLSAVECESSGSPLVSGFPVNLDGKISSELYKSNVKNSRVVFYVQNGNVVSYNLASREKVERAIENIKFIVPALVFEKAGKEPPALWAVTNEGTVYLLTEKLKDPAGFPVMTGYEPSSKGTAFEKGLAYNGKGQILVSVDYNGNALKTQTDSFDDITAEPLCIPGQGTVLYERSFMGGFHVIPEKGDSLFISADGIGYGSPDYLKAKGKTLIGFVSQAGNLQINDISVSEDPVTVDLEGVFYLNTKACGESFVALSEDGILSSVNAVSGEVIKVKVPHLTARTGFISSADFDEDGKNEIFVCGDGNVIYGFRENLEMIGCFPVPGYGSPMFFDLDGNKKNDVVCLSLDNKINAWKLSY